MNSAFSAPRAAQLNALALLATLIVLIATPVPATLFIGLIMLYSMAYLVAHRQTLHLTRGDWLIMALLLSYLIGRLPPFMLDSFASRYLSAPLHVAASIPIYLMLRHAAPTMSLTRYRGVLEWGAALGAIGGGALASYQALALGAVRAEGFMFYLNFAYLACSLMLICLALIPGSRRRWLLAAGVLGAFLAILFSATRGVLLALPVLLFAAMLLNIHRIGAWRLAAAGFVLLACSLLSYFTIPMVQERVDFTIEELRHIQHGEIEAAISSGGRIQLWTAAVEAYKARPSVGLTYPEREAQIDSLVAEGVLTEWMLGINRGHAHSQYFEVLATGGTLGILALGGYLLTPFAGFLYCHRRRRDDPFAQAGVLFSLGFIVYCLTEVALQKELIAAWYGYIQVNLAALTLAWQARAPQETPATRT